MMNYNIEFLKNFAKEKIKNKKIKKCLILGVVLVAFLFVFFTTMGILIHTNTITLPPAIEAIFMDGGEFEDRYENSGERDGGENDTALFAPTTALVTSSIVLAIAILSSTTLHILYRKNMVDNIDPLPILYNGGDNDEKK